MCIFFHVSTGLLLQKSIVESRAGHISQTLVRTTQNYGRDDHKTREMHRNTVYVNSFPAIWSVENTRFRDTIFTRYVPSVFLRF